MDAVDALNEIAFWLERELAPTFKVQAFRKAAGIIAGLGPEELAARAADGRLRRTKGIGDRTYQVITEALDGDVPEYLDGLRAGGPGRWCREVMSCLPRCAATCTATVTGPTADPRSRPWWMPPGCWAASTSR